MNYSNLEKYLKENSDAYLHAFRSGSGLRVLRVDKPNSKKAIFYGEGPDLDYALNMLIDNVNGKKQSEVRQYLTGSFADESDKLDFRLAQGESFDIKFIDGYFNMKIDFYVRRNTPKQIREKVLQTMQPVTFEMYNHEFQCSPYMFADNSYGTSTKCLTDDRFDWHIKTGHSVDSLTFEGVLKQMVIELTVLEKEAEWQEL